MKIMVGIRIEPELKEVLENLAKKERRSLNNFIVNAAVIYAKEQHGVDVDNLPQKKPKK